MNLFEEAMVQASAGLDAEGLPHMIIDGAAIVTDGFERATNDVDLTIRDDETGFEQMVGRPSKRFPPRRDDAHDIVRRNRVWLSRVPNGIPVDLAFGRFVIEPEAMLRARRIRIGDRESPCCSPAGLVFCKARSDRPLDDADLRRRIRKFKGERNRTDLETRVAEIARETARDDLLARWKQAWG